MCFSQDFVYLIVISNWNPFYLYRGKYVMNLTYCNLPPPVRQLGCDDGVQFNLCECLIHLWYIRNDISIKGDFFGFRVQNTQEGAEKQKTNNKMCHQHHVEATSNVCSISLRFATKLGKVTASAELHAHSDGVIFIFVVYTVGR